MAKNVNKDQNQSRMQNAASGLKVLSVLSSCILLFLFCLAFSLYQQ